MPPSPLVSATSGGGQWIQLPALGFLLVFTARCYASAALAMGLCLCLSVRLSQVGVL